MVHCIWCKRFVVISDCLHGWVGHSYSVMPLHALISPCPPASLLQLAGVASRACLCSPPRTTTGDTGACCPACLLAACHAMPCPALPCPACAACLPAAYCHHQLGLQGGCCQQLLLVSDCRCSLPACLPLLVCLQDAQVLSGAHALPGHGLGAAGAAKHRWVACSLYL